MTTAYLTIDDAPSTDLPEKIDVLREYDIPAVFFCEGQKLTERPEYGQQILEAGFHIGNHAYSHPHFSELSIEEGVNEILRTEHVIDEIYERCGVDRPVKIFRFPFGDKGDNTRNAFQRALQQHGFTPPDHDQITYPWYHDNHADEYDWYWTFSIEDWNAETQDEIREMISANSERLQHSSPDIVLAHDHPDSTELFEMYIETLLDHGVSFEPPRTLFR
jgi:peptidoglycan/xylan/chitin deacetylase (PgdA/CDA1 family)